MSCRWCALSNLPESGPWLVLATKLPNHLVGAQQDGVLKVDGEFVLRRLLDGQCLTLHRLRVKCPPKDLSARCSVQGLICGSLAATDAERAGL